MNEIQYRAATATAAIVGLNAALAVGQATWPAPEPLYVTEHSSPSFSFFEVSLNTTNQDFAKEIASVFAELSKGQEPLGAEFEAVWDDNLDALYES
jgi:hypothetical protein